MARVFATLRSALNQAVKRGELAHNPCAHVELQPVKGPEVHPWTPDEATQFLGAVEDHRLYPLFALAIVSGVRRGELCGLRWSDVDLEAGELTVRQQATQRGGEIRFADPKSDRSKGRVVALDDWTVDLLAKHQIHQGLDRLAWGDDYQDHGLVFCHEDGTPLRPDYLTKLLPRLADKAGTRRTRFHDLRHASATFGIAAGEKLLEVSRRLGHSSIALTGDTYSHTVPQRVREAAKKRASLVLGEAS